MPILFGIFTNSITPQQRLWSLLLSRYPNLPGCDLVQLSLGELALAVGLCQKMSRDPSQLQLICGDSDSADVLKRPFPIAPEMKLFSPLEEFLFPQISKQAVILLCVYNQLKE